MKSVLEQSEVQILIDELLDSESTPEEVCRSRIELLPMVRERWQKICNARAQLDELFPPNRTADDASKSSASDVLAHPTIPGYEVESVLGVGGMGIVFRARHLRLNRVVAVKMAISRLYEGPVELQRFQHEAEAVASLQHANVVQIYDVGDLDGRPYFTMEYVEGGSLAQMIAGKPQPPVTAASLVATLANAVQAAHEVGILHRDLKPANILLTVEGIPKITDFGLARRLGGEAGLTRTGIMLGTPSYMAPEQARGKSHSTASSVDVYALGSILYELLTGRPPFQGETTAETIFQLLSLEPVPPSRLHSSIPRDLETICLKCLHKEPRLRYESAAALRDDIRRFQQGRAILARPLPAGEQLWRWVQRNPTSTLLIAFAMCAIIATISAGFWVQRREADQRTALALEEGKAWQAVEASLDKAVELREQARWPEVRAALQGAQALLGPTTPQSLLERVRQAKADADMVADLENIRLQLADGTGGPKQAPRVPASMYAEAFRKYGIDLTMLDSNKAKLQIEQSAIRDTLIAYLHDWLYWSHVNHETAQAFVDQVDDNLWRRDLRAAITSRDGTQLRTLAIAPEALVQAPVVLSGLCGSLLVDDYRSEALALLSQAQRRHPDDFWINYLLGHYWDKEKPELAVGYFRAALAIRPTSDQGYALLGKALRNSGDSDGAIAAFRTAIALNSDCALHKDLAKLLAPTGALEEARIAWKNYLAVNPPDHESWYGYAQLCLFLGNIDAYKSARKDLLDRFGESNQEWYISERTAAACMLLPLDGDELQRVTKVVDHAEANGPKHPHSDFGYIQFVKGFAEYRRGHFEAAIPLLQKAAATLTNRASPGLVLAMAQHRVGFEKESHDSLQLGLGTVNWNELVFDQPTVWINYVLRREAEELILSKQPALAPDPSNNR